MFDLNEAIEAISAVSHDAWRGEKIRQGFADHLFDPVHIPDLGISVCHTCLHKGDTEIDWERGRVMETYSFSQHHPDMRPFADLSEKSKDFNRQMVRRVFDWLELKGYKVVSRWGNGAQPPTDNL